MGGRTGGYGGVRGRRKKGAKMGTLWGTNDDMIYDKLRGIARRWAFE